MRKCRVVGKINGMKYGWNGHKDGLNRRKNGIERSGQARLVSVKTATSPPREGEPAGTSMSLKNCWTEEDDRKKKEQKNTFTLQCCLRPALPLPSGFIDLSGRTSLYDHFTFLCPPKLSKFSKTIRLHISLLRIIFFRRSNSSFRFNKYFQRSGYAAGKLTRSPFDRPWSIPPLWASSTSLC